MKLPKTVRGQVGTSRRERKRIDDDALPDGFDARTYLILNPDVAQSGTGAAEHYKSYGRQEKRAYTYDTPIVDEKAIPDDFDEAMYLDINKDVSAAGLDPIEHYTTFGRKEGRVYKKELGSRVESQGYILDRSTASNAPWGSLSKALKPRLIAFYLPQFHRVKENDEWWGEGFTEWTNVKKAKPNFEGHKQPHVPLAKNYYDLSDPSVQHSQAKLAREYGITAFCYYMYWFDGKRILEKPLDLLIENQNIDIEFCICWANENWTRTWDGKDQDILVGQTHSSDSDQRFIADAIKYLRDPRYLKVDGKPILLVYRVDLLPDCKNTAEIWRREAREAGVGELHLCAIQFYGIGDPITYGFDAAVEFPPHGWLDRDNQRNEPYKLTNKSFAGQIFDYKKSVDFALQKPRVNYTRYRCAFPGWDNTARRQNTSHIFADPNPFEFERWLTGLLRQAVIESEPDSQLVFINAWNEWAEGAHLEPDENLGVLSLQSVHSAINTVVKEAGLLNLLARLRTPTVYNERPQDEEALLNLFRGQERSLKALSKMLADATNLLGKSHV